MVCPEIRKLVPKSVVSKDFSSHVTEFSDSYSFYFSSTRHFEFYDADLFREMQISSKTGFRIIYGRHFLRTNNYDLSFII